MKKHLLLIFLLFSQWIYCQKHNDFSDLVVRFSKNTNDTSLFYKCANLVSPEKYHTSNQLSLFKQSVLKQKSPQLVNAGLSRLINYYNSKGDYSEAIKTGVQLEKFVLENQDSSKLSKVYNLIGNTYLGLKNSEKIIEYYKKCFDIATIQKDNTQMAYGAGGLANYYNEIKDYQKALEWNMQSLKNFDKTNIEFAKVIIRINIAENYRRLGNFEDAHNMLKSAERILPHSKLNYCYILFYSSQAEQYKIEKKYDLAVQSCHKAIHYAKKDNAIHNLAEIYLLLAQILELNGDFKDALFAQKQFQLFNDSVFNQENNKQIVEIEEQYKSEKKDAEIQLLQKSNQLNNSELKRKTNLVFAFGIAAILVVGMLIVLWISGRRKSKMNSLLATKNKEIEEKQEEILSSINYAKRIQFALLASDYLLQSNLNKYFVFFQPKDIVSGDFYWAIKTETHFFVAVCDCTGHGVPGAFMSLLNINFLKEAITEKLLVKPGEIFDFVRARLIENLNEEGYNDGMDGVLLVFDLNSPKIMYAGANKAPILISNNQVVDLTFDKMPIGKGVRSDAFQTHELMYSKNDLLYLYTDGFTDQFGGEQVKKFKLKNLKTLLVEQANLDVTKQLENIMHTFNSWKGELEQIDDVCIFGIQL
ncbi:MAG TPA: SpoIIE family protein phosphatase [Fluviicola sp.]|nr:SpoIIE family protein phosphatase [Fluviicola sp.]